MSHLVFCVLAEKAQKQGHLTLPTKNIKPPALEGHQINFCFHGQLHYYRNKKLASLEATLVTYKLRPTGKVNVELLA